MTRKFIALFLSFFLSASLSGCSKQASEPISEVASPDVVSAASPMSGVLASGGKAVSENTTEWINATSLDIISSSETNAQVNIQFVLGSARDGMDEAIIDYVPEYNVYYLEHPARLVVELQNLSFWSYENTLAVPEDSLFYGIFKQIESTNNGFSIIFQLRDDVDVQVKDEKNTLSLDFTVREKQDDGKYYYVMADARNEFNTSGITKGDLFPSYSNDLNNIVLLSKPYKTEAEATADLQQLIADNNALSENNTFEIGLEGNDLPSYGDQSKFAAVYSQKVISQNGQSDTLPVVIPDGLYLGSTPDGSLALFSKQEAVDNSENTYDTLWVLDASGRVKPLYEIEFSSIDEAKFSPDGRRVAFLDKSGEDSILYVYDLDTAFLSNLSEEGLDSMTSSFIWDSLGTAIYAISGSDDSQQLVKYDFAIQNEDARVTAVEEYEIGEGDLGYLNGELYYTNVSENNEEVIYKIKPEGGLHTEFSKGSSFCFSPDGQYMTLLRSVADIAGSTVSDDEGMSESNNVTFVLHNMQTNEEVMIEDNAYITTYTWAPDGKVYYTKSISDDFSSEFSFLLRYYDPTTSQIVDVAELSTSDFSTTPDPNVLFINLIGREDSLPIRATYKFTINH